MSYGEMKSGGCGCGCHQETKSNHKDPFLAKNYNNNQKKAPKTKPKKKSKNTHTMPDGTVMTGKKHSKSSKVVY